MIFADPLNPTFFYSFIGINFACFWTKTIKETSKGNEVLLDDSCSFDGNLVIAQAVHLNFHRLKNFAHGFQPPKHVKVSSHKTSLYMYDIKNTLPGGGVGESPAPPPVNPDMQCICMQYSITCGNVKHTHKYVHTRAYTYVRKYVCTLCISCILPKCDCMAAHPTWEGYN